MTESIETSLVSALLRRILCGEPVSEQELVALLLSLDDRSQLDMLVRLLGNLIAQMSDVTSAITRVAHVPSTQRLTQSPLLHELALVRSELVSTQRSLLAMIAQSSSSMRASPESSTVFDTGTLGD